MFCTACGVAHPGMACPRSPQKLNEMKKAKEKQDKETEARKAVGGK